MTDRFIYTVMDDPRALPLIEALSADYIRLYGAEYGEDAALEMTRYPAARFTPPEGAFLLLQRDGVTIGGGAFKSYGRETGTAEFKRIWVHDDFRRQGLAQAILVELEAQAARQGYRRVYLTTGFRQAAATALYRTTGYTPLFDVNADLKTLLKLPFEKTLTPG
ncbi:hypothetical protein sos41_36030 [Alphaproteobacteria bacterium SO-S41]|nr:hypothetical protein sos41_36030 [Alphaproteobacteria bacterium SO-S41]